jgi:predicted PurR-regulated permease PerM
MFAIAIMSGIGLALLHIPFAVALAVLAGLLAFVPNVGAFVAVVPSALLALAISPQRAALVLVMYWVAHSIDDFLLIPIAERRIVHLPPALTILVQIGLGAVFGVLGVTFAAPLTATAIVAIRSLRSDTDRDDSISFADGKARRLEGTGVL